VSSRFREQSGVPLLSVPPRSHLDVNPLRRVYVVETIFDTKSTTPLERILPDIDLRLEHIALDQMAPGPNVLLSDGLACPVHGQTPRDRIAGGTKRRLFLVVVRPGVFTTRTQPGEPNKRVQ